MNVEFSVRDLIQWVVSEGALVVFFYYALLIFDVQGNLWVHSVLLTVLITISTLFCPLVGRCMAAK